MKVWLAVILSLEADIIHPSLKYSNDETAHTANYQIMWPQTELLLVFIFYLVHTYSAWCIYNQLTLVGRYVGYGASVSVVTLFTNSVVNPITLPSPLVYTMNSIGQFSCSCLFVCWTAASEPPDGWLIEDDVVLSYTRFRS